MIPLCNILMNASRTSNLLTGLKQIDSNLLGLFKEEATKFIEFKPLYIFQ